MQLRTKLTIGVIILSLSGTFISGFSIYLAYFRYINQTINQKLEEGVDYAVSLIDFGDVNRWVEGGRVKS